jgi:hypothetical protein
MSLYSSASDYAKDTWLPVYPDMLQQSQGSMLNLLGLKTDDRVKIEGRKTYMKIQVGDDLGFGVTSQGGDLPAPGDIASDEATLELMRFADAIEFDAHEMALLDSLSAAAAPIMAKKMDASRIRVLRELERMAIMDGSGKLAKVASEVGSTITLDVAGAEYAERNPYTWIDDPKRSYYGVIDPTDGTWQTTAADSFTVISNVESTNVLTLSIDAGGAAAGDYIVTYHPGTDAYSVGGAFASPEFDGLLALIDDGNTYMGLDRSSIQQWRATVVDNSGTNRDITENLVHELMNKTGRRSQKGVLLPSEYCAIADPGTWTAYHNLMSTGIRYTISESPDIGWGGRQSLSMDGVPLYKHFQAPRNQILLVHKDSVGFVGPKHDTSSIVEFLSRNGSIFFQQTASSGQGYADKTIAYIQGWMGMYSERPRNHGRLDDLNTTAAAY